MNWFRKGDDGKFLWPGFGDNARVLEWVVDRCAGRGGAVPVALGWLPPPGAIDLDGLAVSDEDMAKLVAVDGDEWRAEVALVADYYATFGDRLPAALDWAARRAQQAPRPGLSRPGGAGGQRSTDGAHPSTGDGHVLSRSQQFDPDPLGLS